MNAARRARAEAHVRTLGRKNGVIVRRVSTWEKAAARPDLRVVWVPTMRSAQDYLTALHEFGHVLDRRAAKLYSQGGYEDTATELVMEAAAWAWGLKHADREVVGEMSEPLRREIGRCWASFLCIKFFRPTTERV